MTCPELPDRNIRLNRNRSHLMTPGDPFPRRDPGQDGHPGREFLDRNDYLSRKARGVVMAPFLA